MKKTIFTKLRRPEPRRAILINTAASAVLCAAVFVVSASGGSALRALIAAAAWLVYLAVFAAVLPYMPTGATEAPDITPDDAPSVSPENIPPEAVSEKRGRSGFEYNFFASCRAELLYKLLVGNFDVSREELGEHGITFPYKYFGVALTRLDHLKTLDPTEVPLIKYGIINIGNEVFGKYLRAYGVEVSEHDIAWIVNYDNVNELFTSIEQIKYFITDIYHCTASFGCDFDNENSEDISDMFNNAKYALSYRITRGYNSTIIYRELTDVAPGCEYPEAVEKRIAADISFQDKASLKTDVGAFMKGISAAPYSVILTHANRLLYAVDALAARSGNGEGFALTNHMEKMTRIETIEEIETYILNRCTSAALKLCNIKTDSKKDMLAETVKSYIDEHFTDPNLSIDAIADTVGRSANYTRSVFKSACGISVSDYISNKRFDEICRLLASTELPAQEIGKRVGMSSGSYFYTAFKKRAGCTPEQYRKNSKISDGEES